MLLNRSSGILLHISSLPGKYGTGSLGKEAEEFISFLKNSGIKYWQILPMGPVSSSMCYSPYSSTSAFAGNPPMEKDHIDFKKVEKIYEEVLKLAWKNFQKHAGDEEKNELKRFCEKNSFWLEDYCLYEIIAEKSQNYDWRKWSAPLSHKTMTGENGAHPCLIEPRKKWPHSKINMTEKWRNTNSYSSYFRNSGNQ